MWWSAGSVNVPTIAPANYTLLLDCDDGCLLYIDGNLIVSNPGGRVRVMVRVRIRVGVAVGARDGVKNRGTL